MECLLQPPMLLVVFYCNFQVFFALTLYERHWQQSWLAEVFNKHTSRWIIARKKLVVASISNWESHFLKHANAIQRPGSKYFNVVSVSRRLSWGSKQLRRWRMLIDKVIYVTKTAKFGPWPATSTSCDLKWRHYTKHRIDVDPYLHIKSFLDPEKKESKRDCQKVAQRTKTYCKKCLCILP